MQPKTKEALPADSTVITASRPKRFNIRPCHKAAILPQGTKKALFYHAKPHPHGFHCEA